MTGRTARFATAALGASLIVGSLAANAGNYLANVLLGRWLDPGAYGEASLLVTFVLLLAIVTTAMSQVIARATAERLADGGPEDVAALRNASRRVGLGIGLIAALALAALSPTLATTFKLATGWSLAILALGLPLYFTQAVERGVLLGRQRYGRLAASYVAETGARLVVGSGAVVAGLGAPGAAIGLVASFAASWVVARGAGAGLPHPGAAAARLRRLLPGALPVVVVLIGQVVLANADLVVAKAMFEPEVAGRYAAVALLGRAVLFVAAPIGSIVFPIIVARHRHGLATGRVALGSTLGVMFLVAPALVGAMLAPGAILGVLFGPAYVPAAGLLGPIVAAAALGAVASHVSTLLLARDERRAGFLALVAAAAQLGLLAAMHDDPTQVARIGVLTQGALTLGSLALLATTGRPARTPDTWVRHPASERRAAAGPVLDADLTPTT